MKSEFKMNLQRNRTKDQNNGQMANKIDKPVSNQASFQIWETKMLLYSLKKQVMRVNGRILFDSAEFSTRKIIGQVARYRLFRGRIGEN